MNKANWTLIKNYPQFINNLLGCGNCKGGIKADLNGNILDKLETNGYVVFECETIEYANKNRIDSIIDNLNRISGGDIFSVHTIGGLHTSMGKTLKYPMYAIVFLQRWAYYILFPKEDGLAKQLITDCPPTDGYKYLTF